MKTFLIALIILTQTTVQKDYTFTNKYFTTNDIYLFRENELIIYLDVYSMLKDHNEDLSLFMHYWDIDITFENLNIY